MGKPGRPRIPEDRPKPVKRSFTIPPDVYERFKNAAARDRRDVTSLLVKVMEDFLNKSEKESGNSLAMQGVGSN